MAVEVIPAIDLREGRCVRLLQGRFTEETVYSEQPVEVALGFQQEGARRLHMVDLDGARQGRPANLKIVEAIASRLDIPIELGGGIRDLETIDAVFAAGVQYAILGTIACEKPGLVAEACRLYPGRIIAGIDARQGKVAVRGWVDSTEIDALELARRMGDYGVKEIIFTDITRDGTLSGPNLAALRRMTGAGVNIIASGGVSSLQDIRDIAALASEGVTGVIVGRALYSGQFTLKEAIAAAGGEPPQAGEK